MRKFYITFFILYSITKYAQNESTKKDSILLKEVVLISESKIKVKQDKGKYIVNLINTDFQKTQNTWEGLKLIPMIRANDNESLKVKSKNAIIEINGNQIQLTGNELESYLKSLDPKTIKRIELISNPNASYDSNVESVINIILSQRSNNYRIGSNITNGIRTKYFNNSNANINYNLEKIRIYSSYGFNYNQRVNESTVMSQINNNPLSTFDYEEENLQKNHQYYLNLNYEINNKNNIDFTTTGTFNNLDKNGLSKNMEFNRFLNMGFVDKKIQFAEIYKHIYNDSTFLKIGSYQVFKNSESQNNAITNNTTTENQFIKSKIPLLIGFLDFNKATKLGDINTGVRFNNIQVNKDNISESINNPYNYKETILAMYLNNSFSITNQSSINMGVRLESSFIDYKFNDIVNSLSINDNLKYSNLLYNVSYMNSTEKDWHHSIAFRKQIQRPNYSYLNPFLNLNSDISYFSGDTKIKPAKLYSINYDLLKNNWSLYIQAGFINDFISTFTDEIDTKIVETYKNFDTVLISGFGFEYNPTIIKKTWYSRVNFDLAYFKIDDKNYPNIESSSPNINFELSNILKFKKYQVNLNYNITPTYKDGLIKHFSNQRLNFTVSKRLNNNFSVFIYAYDILKTNRTWEETTLPNYFYSTKRYNDERTFGLTLRWSLTGKTYKKRDVENIEDNSIDRL